MVPIVKLFEIIMVSIIVLGVMTAILGYFLDRKIFGKVSTTYTLLGIIMTIFGILSLTVIRNGLFGMALLFDFLFLLVVIIIIYFKMMKG